MFQVEEAGTEGGVARDTDALSLLDNRKTRNLLLDDLHELECFLLQRQAESGQFYFWNTYCNTVSVRKLDFISRTGRDFNNFP